MTESRSTTLSEAVLRTFAAGVASTHRRLTELDQAVGDGDFGDNLDGGLRQVVARLDALAAAGPVDDHDAVAAAAAVFLDEIGGTSGPLLGLLLDAVARALPPGPTDAARGWLDGLADGTAAIQRVGEAEPGDRTLVDALDAARRAAPGGGQVGQVGAALGAALAATVATAGWIARRGRSSYLGERSIGVPDPGCVGICLLLWSLTRVVEPAAAADWPDAAALVAATVPPR